MSLVIPFSPDFPITPGAYDRDRAGLDAFVTRSLVPTAGLSSTRHSSEARAASKATGSPLIPAATPTSPDRRNQPTTRLRRSTMDFQSRRERFRLGAASMLSSPSSTQRARRWSTQHTLVERQVLIGDGPSRWTFRATLTLREIPRPVISRPPTRFRLMYGGGLSGCVRNKAECHGLRACLFDLSPEEVLQTKAVA